jgi:hypothetical protein
MLASMDLSTFLLLTTFSFVALLLIVRTLCTLRAHDLLVTCLLEVRIIYSVDSTTVVQAQDRAAQEDDETRVEVTTTSCSVTNMQSDHVEERVFYVLPGSRET